MLCLHITRSWVWMFWLRCFQSHWDNLKVTPLVTSCHNRLFNFYLFVGYISKEWGRWGLISTLWNYVFHKRVIVWRSVLICSEFYICLHSILKLPQTLLVLQSGGFPEDPRVGHQSTGRQDYQRLLPWGVSHTHKHESQWNGSELQWDEFSCCCVQSVGVEVTWPALPFHLPLGVCVHLTLSFLQRGPGQLQGLHADLSSLPADWGQREKQEPPHQWAAQQPDQQAAVWVRDQRPCSAGVCVCVHNLSIYLPVAFRLYDLDRDDKISRDELLQVSVWRIDAAEGWNNPLTHHKRIHQPLNVNLCWMFRLWKSQFCQHHVTFSHNKPAINSSCLSGNTHWCFPASVSCWYLLTCPSLQVLRMMVGVNISDDQLGSIADRTIQEADTNGDNSISFNEFIKASFPAALWIR